ncbi:MAG: hypothetical protein ABI123_00105 [Ginsengibacter sp.]|jgi:hypothetical protein
MKKLLLFLVPIIILASAGCKSITSDSPDAVLNHFLDALNKKDMQEAKKYTTKDSEGMLSMIEMGMKNIPDSVKNETYDKKNMEMSSPVINGDKATIHVKDKKSGEGSDFTLKKESGDWKVAFDKSTLMNMAQDKMKEKGFDQKLPEGMEGEDFNMDSLQNALKNIPQEDIDKAKKMMDSVMKNMPKQNQ